MQPPAARGTAFEMHANLMQHTLTADRSIAASQTRTELTCVVAARTRKSDLDQRCSAGGLTSQRHTGRVAGVDDDDHLRGVVAL